MTLAERIAAKRQALDAIDCVNLAMLWHDKTDYPPACGDSLVLIENELLFYRQTLKRVGCVCNFTLNSDWLFVDTKTGRRYAPLDWIHKVRKLIVDVRVLDDCPYSTAWEYVEVVHKGGEPRNGTYIQYKTWKTLSGKWKP